MSPLPLLLAAALLPGIALAKPTARRAPRPPAEDAMPKSQFEPLPGWLGYAVAPRTERQLPWTPHHPHATVVLLDPGAGWDDLDEGTAFRGLSPAGDLALTYSELSSVPIGCDDVPARMVAFTGAVDPPEGPVWVTPGAGGKALTVAEAEVTADHRRWTAGRLEVEVKRTGEHEGRLVLRDAGKRVFDERWEKQAIDAVQLTPADLTAPWDTAVPAPAGAFVLPGGERVLVLRTLGYEGITFDVLTDAGGAWRSVGSQYVYMCAV